MPVRRQGRARRGDGATERRHDALADNVVEFGPAFVACLQRAAADPAAAGLVASDPGLPAELAGLAGHLLTDWLGGDPGQDLLTMVLRSWPWQRWDGLLDAPDGWRRLLAGAPEIGRPPGKQAGEPPRDPAQDALDRLIGTADRVLGGNIRDLISRTGEGTRTLAIVPHRWLHLIPFWALPALEGLPLSVFSSVDDFVTSRSAPRAASSPETAPPECLVVANPTGDLLCSASEAESAARLAETLPPVLLAGEQATTRRISAGLRNATVFHFSGHAYSDHGEPDRSALLVAPADGTATDPFPDWTAAARRWHTTHDGWRTADIPGAGRLWERGHSAAGDLERRMERGSQPTIYARYADRQLGRLGEEWSVGDILALGERSACRLAFLSACSSGTAGGRSTQRPRHRPRRSPPQRPRCCATRAGLGAQGARRTLAACASITCITLPR